MSMGTRTKTTGATADFTAEDVPGFLAEALDSGDPRAVPRALRIAADVIGVEELCTLTGFDIHLLRQIHSESDDRRATAIYFLALSGDHDRSVEDLIREWHRAGAWKRLDQLDQLDQIDAAKATIDSTFRPIAQRIRLLVQELETAMCAYRQRADAQGGDMPDADQDPAMRAAKRSAFQKQVRDRLELAFDAAPKSEAAQLLVADLKANLTEEATNKRWEDALRDWRAHLPETLVRLIDSDDANPPPAVREALIDAAGKSVTVSNLPELRAVVEAGIREAARSLLPPGILPASSKPALLEIVRKIRHKGRPAKVDSEGRRLLKLYGDLSRTKDDADAAMGFRTVKGAIERETGAKPETLRHYRKRKRPRT